MSKSIKLDNNNFLDTTGVYDTTYKRTQNLINTHLYNSLGGHMGFKPTNSYTQVKLSVPFSRYGILFFAGANGSPTIGIISMEVQGAYLGFEIQMSATGQTPSFHELSFENDAENHIITINGMRTWSYYTFISPFNIEIL